MTPSTNASPAELLHQLIMLEREQGSDASETLDLVYLLKEKLAALPTSEIFALIYNSRDLKSDDGYWTCVSTLHRRPEIGTFELCATWAKDPRAEKRQAAADILGQLGDPSPFAEVSIPILELLLNDVDTDVLASALSACGALGIGTPKVLASFANHLEQHVRVATVRALSGRDDRISIEGLVALTRDTSRDVRNWATFALGQLTTADTSDIREALLERIDESDAEIRGEALIGLAQRGDIRVLKPIEQELTGEFHGAWCIEAAHTLKLKSFGPLLVALKERLTAENLEAFGAELDDAIAACCSISHN